MPLPLLTPDEVVTVWVAEGAPAGWRCLLRRPQFAELVEAVADCAAGPIAIAIGHDPGCPCERNRTLPLRHCRCDIVRLTFQRPPVQV